MRHLVAEIAVLLEMKSSDTTTMVEALAAASVNSGGPVAVDNGVGRTTDPAVRKLQGKYPEFPKYDGNPEHFMPWFVAVEERQELRQLSDQAANIFATEALEEHARGTAGDGKRFWDWREFEKELKNKFCPQTVEYNVLRTLRQLRVQWGNFPFYVNQYALGNTLLKNSRKVKPDTIRTAFLFGLELEMQVELLKRDKNDEIDTLEQCIAAAWKIHGEPHVPRQVVQNFYGYGGVDPKVAMT